MCSAPAHSNSKIRCISIALANGEHHTNSSENEEKLATAATGFLV